MFMEESNDVERFQMIFFFFSFFLYRGTRSLSYPDSKVHGANMGPTWVLSAPDGPHDGFMNLAIWVVCFATQ